MSHSPSISGGNSRSRSFSYTGSSRMSSSDRRYFPKDRDSTNAESLREENRKLNARLDECEKELFEATKKADEILQSRAPESVQKDELVKSKTQLIGKLEQKLAIRNGKLKKFDSRLKSLLEELSSKDKIISTLKTKLMLEEEQSTHSQVEFKKLQRDMDSNAKEELEALKSQMQSKQSAWESQRSLLKMEKEALQKKLNETMMQSHKVTMQMGEMTNDLRMGLRERENLNAEKQTLRRQLQNLNVMLGQEKERVSRLQFEIRKVQEEVKEYHRYLKWCARDFGNSIEALKIVQSKTPGFQVDIVGKTQILLKVLKFVESRSKITNMAERMHGHGIPSSHSLSGHSTRSFRSNSSPGIPQSSIHGMFPGDRIRDNEERDIGGSPLPGSVHSVNPWQPSRSNSPRKRSPSLGSNLSDLSLNTDSEWQPNAPPIRSPKQFPIPPLVRNKNQHQSVRTDGLEVHREPKKNSEVVSLLRKNQHVFVGAEVDGFIQIVEPNSGWVVKEFGGEMTLQFIYEEYQVVSDSITVFDAIDGSEVKNILKDEHILSSEKIGDWIYSFFPWGGWIKIHSADDQIALKHRRFLTEQELFRDFTHPGYKIMKFHQRPMIQYGMILQPRVHQGEPVVMVTETIASNIRREVPISSVLYSINRMSVKKWRYIDVMKALETCRLPVIIVFRLPDLIQSSPPFPARKLSVQSLPTPSQTGHMLLNTGTSRHMYLSGSSPPMSSIPTTSIQVHQNSPRTTLKPGSSPPLAPVSNVYSSTSRKLKKAHTAENSHSIHVNFHRNEVIGFLRNYSDPKYWRTSSNIDGMTTCYHFRFLSNSFQVEVNGLLAIIIYLSTFLLIDDFSPLPLLPLVHAPPNRVIGEISRRLDQILRKLQVQTQFSWEFVYNLLGLTVEVKRQISR